MPAILVDATDLGLWANRRDSQGRLPQLVRRLIHATARRLVRIGFRAGEGVQTGGWDGIVVTQEETPFVPSGVSAWEASAGDDPGRSADENYEKRSNDTLGVDPAEGTFVFVTPRRWGGKRKWEAARQEEAIWRDVRAYDADDLEATLEIAPAVHVWLSILLGKRPENATDLDSFWADWSETTRPTIKPEFVLSGRSEVVEKLHAWLREQSGPLALKAESRNEAVAVFAAAIQQLPLEERVVYLSRTVVVGDLVAWHRLSTSAEPLILLPAFNVGDALAGGSRGGHGIVVPLGNSDSSSATTIIVPRLSRGEAAKALVAEGVAEERARELATLARRSLMSFRRRLAERPEVQQPAWARAPEARALLPALLAGSWKDSSEADRDAVAALSQTSYAELNDVLARWSNESDPPVRRIGDAWYVASKEDAWGLLSRYLTPDDLKRFERTLLAALGAPDPRFDLPAGEQWMAGIRGKSRPHSGLLLDGFADTLAVMGTRGDTPLPLAGAPARDFAARIVRSLLESANADWRVWASLSGVLPLLAEADPEGFLSAVDRGLTGDEPVLLKIFTDKDKSLFGSSPHTGLLFALETLAWGPEHLGRIALILAKLDRVDPGGKLLNRPQHTLRGIFLLWCPQTAATLDQRLSVIDSMRAREPEASWLLQRQLLPRVPDVGHTSAKPRWREWTYEPFPTVPMPEYVRSVREVVNRMLEDVGENGKRWSDLIEALGNLPKEQYDAVVNRLSKLDPDRLQPSNREAIWQAMRGLIAQHRSFPNADWALPSEQVDRLEEIYSKFEPTSLTTLYSWLFDDSATLPNARNKNWEEQRGEVDSVRLDAVRAIHARDGLSGLLELLGVVKQPFLLGLTLGKSELLVDNEDELLGGYLAADDTNRAMFARGLVVGRVASRGRETAESKLAGVAKDWTPRQRAELLVSVSSDTKTWDLADAMGLETEREYWRLAPLFGVEGTQNTERVVRKLIEHGRPYRAVDFLGMRKAGGQPVASPLIADVLEAMLRTSPAEDTPGDLLAYHVSGLLDVLERSEGFDESRIAALEWQSLPFLRSYHRSPKLLHREFARNPDFFVHVVGLLFRAEGEDQREPSDDERARAENAWELLESWRIVPGSDGAGNVDANVLKAWVRRSREGLRKSGRGDVGDNMIGKLLSGSVPGPDGVRPHPAVREVIEEVVSDSLESGFETGKFNSRGVVTKAYNEGGRQEHELADQFGAWAAQTADRWPRTSAMLRRIEGTYRRMGQVSDQEAELREDLDR